MVDDGSETTAGSPASSGEPKRKKVVSRRVTEKGGTRPPSTAPTSAARDKDKDKPKDKGKAKDEPHEFSSRRYTPPSHHAKPPSPTWVPVLMFALIIVGSLVIILNYVGVLGGVSNIKLVIGLGLILAGIIAATQYR